MSYVIVAIVFLAIGFGLGILYKGRKFKPIIAVLKDPNLTAEEKYKKILEIL